MIADWDTDTAVFADLLPRQLPALWDRLAGVLRDHGVGVHLAGNCRDIWARDFLPVQVGNEFVSFRYDPDYLRDFGHLRTDEAACDSLPFLTERRTSDLVIDGGNLVSSGSAVVLTDKIYRENPGRKREDVRSSLSRLLDASECVVIPKEPGDPIGHADGVVRFLDERTVVTNDYSDIDLGYGRRVDQVLARHGFEVVRIPYSVDPTVTDGIPSAVGNRVNFLRVGGLIVMPAYGVSTDAEATAVIQNRLPSARIVSLDCTDLARRGGVLNCVAATYRLASEVSPTIALPPGPSVSPG